MQYRAFDGRRTGTLGTGRDGEARELMIARKTSHHQLFDLHKLRHQLGYTDQTPVVEALTNTVQFYVDNPPNEESRHVANVST